jgi:hypothetical protein
MAHPTSEKKIRPANEDRIAKGRYFSSPEPQRHTEPVFGAPESSGRLRA